MPLAFLVIGTVFLIAAVRGEHKKFFDLLKADFTGPDNFIKWALAIFIIGALGYYRPLKGVSVAFMTLLIVVLFLSHKGFFNQFMSQIGATEKVQGGGSDLPFLSKGASDAISKAQKLVKKIL